MKNMLLAGAALAALTTPALPQSSNVAGFYDGKTIELYIGYSAGGGYDTYARLLARYMGELIPGKPQVVPQNYPGAGSLRLTNWLYEAAPKDGTVFGAVGRGAAFEPMLTGKGVDFEPVKFNWIGSMNNEVSVCVSWQGTGIQKFEDLRKKEMIVGGTGRSADTDQFPRVLNVILGTKMKVVEGYPGGNEINLAMERGEVQGRCGWSWSSVVSTRPTWLADKKINVLVQIALKKHPDLPDTPLITDLVDSLDDKRVLQVLLARQSMGRPFVAPPGVPQERVNALREAFMETMKDPKFIAEAKKGKLEIDPVSGKEVQSLVEDVYDTPEPLVKRAREAVAG